MTRLIGTIALVLACVVIALVPCCGGDGDGAPGLVVTEVSTDTLPPAGVRVVFTVRDGRGEPVSGLDITEVEVMADDRPLASEGVDEPVLVSDPGSESSVLLLLDLSNGTVDSGAESLDAELDAALEMVGYLVPEHRVAVYVYAGPSHFGAVVPFTSDASRHEEVIGPSDSLRGSEGLGTRDMYDAITWALDDLEAAGGGDGLVNRALVLFAGGPDQAMAQDPVNIQARIEAGAAQGVRVFTIGVGAQADAGELRDFGPDGTEQVDDPLELPAAGLRVAYRIDELSGGSYALGICSPRVGGERTFTLNVEHGGSTGSLTVTYDADGFDMAGCDPAVVADPCAGRQCGMVLGFECGTCEGETPYCNQGWQCSSTPACPGDMVMVPSAEVCIDRYEASEGRGGFPASVAGAEPWVRVTRQEAEDACRSVGRRLCTEEEWGAACQGTALTTYPYGNACRPGSCRGAGDGDPSAVPTGRLTDCEGGYPNLFDMAGNVAEWTSTCAGTTCRAMGGSFFDDDCDLTCTNGQDANPVLGDRGLGFRCCLSLAAGM
jgi:hypothetical protein